MVGAEVVGRGGEEVGIVAGLADEAVVALADVNSVSASAGGGIAAVAVDRVGPVSAGKAIVAAGPPVEVSSRRVPADDVVARTAVDRVGRLGDAAVDRNGVVGVDGVIAARV